jgi:PAS domain S-box-containing protein
MPRALRGAGVFGVTDAPQTVEHQLVLAALADPVVVVACGSGVVVYLNPAAEALFAWTSVDLGGRSLDVILSPNPRSLPEGFAAQLDVRCDGVEDERPVVATARRRDGVDVEVELRPARAGQVLVLSVRSTRRGATEPPVDQSHRLIFENAPLGIFHFDAGGVITACNDAFIRIIGGTREVLVGLQMLSLPDQQIVARVRAALAGERAYYEGPYRSATADKLTPVRVLFAPIVEPDGSVLGGVAIVEDTTEREQMHARLAATDRLASVGTLAAGVAHEINNPLAYVMASVDLAAKKLRDLRRQGADAATLDHMQTSLASAREGAERMSVIIRDLRIFSRVTEERRMLVDIEAVIDEAVQMAWSTIKHRARLHKDYGGVASVWAEESRLGQIFMNLLINAAQAIPEGAAAQNEIRIVTRDAGDRVRVEVSDTGGGIAPEILARVFEPFVTTKSSGEGTGLGLSIVHGIVTALGGEIRVESELGKGATFTITLPTREELGRPASVRPGRQTASER